MPGRSPHRRSPPPPPLISRHSSPRGRARSPDRHHLEMASSSRGRERRELRPTVSAFRRSRSPIPPKRRSFSPPMKRKTSPSREREMSRRTKISKSPVGSRGGSEHGSYAVAAPENDSHTVRSDRFREREYEEERERTAPKFRGPDGSVSYDVNELKKFTVEIIRKPSGTNAETHINRSITNPDEIVPVRRPDSYDEDYHYYNKGRGKGLRDSEGRRSQHENQHLSPPEWMNHEDNRIPFTHKNEGARPLFMRGEATASTSKDHSAPPEDYRRIVAIDPSRVTGGHGREPSPRERVRYSPVPFETNRRQYYPERERSPYETRHRSPPREEYVESRETKPRERRAESRDDLRRDLDVKRREERRYSPERSNYERSSDLRTRIIEKRSEPHSRPEERGEHSSRRYDNERDRHERPHHSPPPRERRRAGSSDRHEARGSRSEPWERERESGGERRRRPHSREREDRGRSRYESEGERHDDSERRRSQPYKSDFEPNRFYKNYEEKEFIPPPNRGRGGPPMRRGIPPVLRGRGIIRGLNRGFRGGMMGGMVRGVPRGPFMGMPRFPPRFFPPY